MIVPKSYEELAKCIEREGKSSSFSQRTGAQTANLSTQPFQKLRPLLRTFALSEWTGMTIWPWPRSGTFSASPVLWS